jgi:hypothetical protein
MPIRSDLSIYFPAINAISTLTSRGSRATSTVARAGGALLKNSAYTAFIFAKSLKLGIPRRKQTKMMV